jgi:beta-galactosidase
VKLNDNRQVKVSVSGAGVLQGFGSARPVSKESFTGDTHHTYYGRAQAIIRSGYSAGEIDVSVSSEGLETIHIQIQGESNV